MPDQRIAYLFFDGKQWNLSWSWDPGKSWKSAFPWYLRISFISLWSKSSPSKVMESAFKSDFLHKRCMIDSILTVFRSRILLRFQGFPPYPHGWKHLWLPLPLRRRSKTGVKIFHIQQYLIFRIVHLRFSWFQLIFSVWGPMHPEGPSPIKFNAKIVMLIARREEHLVRIGKQIFRRRLPGFPSLLLAPGSGSKETKERFLENRRWN